MGVGGFLVVGAGWVLFVVVSCFLWRKLDREDRPLTMTRFVTFSSVWLLLLGATIYMTSMESALRPKSTSTKRPVDLVSPADPLGQLPASDEIGGNDVEATIEQGKADAEAAGSAFDEIEDDERNDGGT